MNNIKTRITRFISVIICIIMIGSSLFIPSLAVFQITELKLVGYRYDSPETYSTDSEYAKSCLSDLGYTVIDQDLNRGVFGDYIYLGYKENTGDPITDIKAVKNGDGQDQIECEVNGKVCTYYIIRDINGNIVDINKNAKGNPDVIYLYYTKDLNAGEPITDLVVSTDTSKADYSTVVWVDSDSPANMNSGAKNSVFYLSEEYKFYIHISRTQSAEESNPDDNENVDTDSVPDGAKCKYCGKVHGDSFFELLIKFLHTIFYILSILFEL